LSNETIYFVDEFPDLFIAIIVFIAYVYVGTFLRTFIKIF